jgi:hypothetical protein
MLPINKRSIASYGVDPFSYEGLQSIVKNGLLSTSVSFSDASKHDPSDDIHAYTTPFSTELNIMRKLDNLTTDLTYSLNFLQQAFSG